MQCGIQGHRQQILSAGPAVGNEVYVRASARYERAGTIGLMLKYYNSWGADEGIGRVWCGTPLLVRNPADSCSRSWVILSSVFLIS